MVSRVGGGVSEDLLADIEEYLYFSQYGAEPGYQGLLERSAEEITKLRAEVEAYECAYQRA